ncbi:MAG: KH domain-containing protein [Oscillospiraceae bacterium]|nr:KH domain-containing protein [Oscillospiraceae bacterium]
MKELLFAITEGLVADPSAIQITEDPADDEGIVVLHLTVAADDMGRVIGKQGRIAKAIRTLMRAAAARENQKVSVEID